MVIIEDFKIAFAFPAKTGSCSTIKFLKNLKCKAEFPIGVHRHITTSDFLKANPHLTDYKIYCFLRNPVSRFISALSMRSVNDGTWRTKRLITSLCNAEELDCEDALNSYFLRCKNLHDEFLFVPQIDYFKEPNVVALDFDNYEAELRKATQGLGLDDVEITRENEGAPDVKELLPSKVSGYVKAKYAEDCALWQEKFGRRIGT